MASNGLKKYFYRFFLKRKLKRFDVVREAKSLDEAKTAGILFDASDPSDYVVINKYADTLRKKGISVHLLGYFNFKRVEGFVNHPYFCKKDLKWYQKPNNSYVDFFINQDMDILINAYDHDCPPLEWVSTFSKAKYRIGRYDRDKIYCNDIMIDIKNPSNDTSMLDSLIHELDHYLNMIKSANAIS